MVGIFELTRVAAEPTFMLGRFPFRLRSVEPEFQEAVSRMMPALADDATEWLGESQPAIVTIDLDAPVETDDHQLVDLHSEGPDLAIAYIVDRALTFHRQVVWIEASTLVDQQGRLTLISGASHSGKTTLSLSLNFSSGSKIVCEDLTLIDLSKNCVIPFARPLSLRDGTGDRIQRATGRAPNAQHTCGCWYFDPAIYHIQPVRLDFTLAVLLAQTSAQKPGPFEADSLSPADMVRKLLPISNLLHVPEAIDACALSLQNAACYLIRGGQLEERIRWLSLKSVSEKQ